MAGNGEERTWSAVRWRAAARVASPPSGRQLYAAAGIVALAAVVVVVLIVVSGDRSSPAPRPVTPAVVTLVQGLVNQWVGGTTETGTIWGRPTAPVTDREYIDPQCSACDQEFVGASRQLGPLGQLGVLIRSGLLKIEFVPRRTVTPTDPMLAEEWAAVLAAARQNKAVEFLFTNYAFQPPERSGRFNTDFIEATAKATPGLDFRRWQTAWASPGIRVAARSAVRQGDASRFTSTPTAVFSSARGKRVIAGAEPVTLYGRAVQALSPGPAAPQPAAPKHG